MYAVIMYYTSLSIAVNYLFACAFSYVFIAMANGMALKPFQFQCIGKQVTQVCSFPEQYCDDGHAECRPCSQDICDKQQPPLQCSYNCTHRAHETIEDQSSNPFIYDNALIWFITTLVLLTILIVVGAATFPIWKPYIEIRWLHDKCRRPNSIPESPAPEENPLITTGKDNALPGELPGEDKNAEETSVLQTVQQEDDDDGIIVNRNSADTECIYNEAEYCERKLKNVNPKEQSDGLSKIATTRSCLSEEKSE